MIRKIQSPKVLAAVALTALLVGLAFIGLASNVTRGLRELHPVLEWIFYIILFIFTTWLIIIPAAQVLTKRLRPLGSILDEDNVPSREEQMRNARWMLKQKLFTEQEARAVEYAMTFDKDLLPHLRTATRRCAARADEISLAHAKTAFVGVTVSQSGPLDIFMLLAINVRLIRDITRAAGVRPSLPELAKLYAFVLISALILDRADQIDLGEFLPAIGSFFAKSLMQGVGAAFVTLRVGQLTRRYLLTGGERLDAAAKLEARSNAKRQIPQVILNSLRELPTGIRSTLEKLMKKQPMPENG